MLIGLWKKGLVLGIIVLFVGIAVQPGIIADDSIESDNSELVEITVQICKGNGANDHTVMLSKEQAEELESIISSTKTKLDAAKTIEEISAIFNDAVVSLYELGVLPEGMSIKDAQRLVNGMDQNPRIVKKLERWFSRNQGNIGVEDNFLCLIAGHTDVHIIIGPSVIPFFVLGLIIWAPSWLLGILFDIQTNFFASLILSLFALFYLNLRYNPLAFGYIIGLGHIPGVHPDCEPVPANGWINTIGLTGKKNWNDNFFGQILGFTGIKICYPPVEDRTYFYIGAALIVDDEY